MYIGLDIGTSGSKAALVDAKGNVLGSWQVSYSFSETAGGYRELDAKRVWEAAKECISKAAAGKEVHTITVSSLGEAIVFANHEGIPVSPGITGTDKRGEEELKAFIEAFGTRALTEITGLNLSTIYSANKILWVKKHLPQIYENAARILTFQDYIIFRLCHEAVIDYSMASRTLLFDIQEKKWSGPLLLWSGIPESKLSRPVRAGSIAGTLDGKIAQELEISGNPRIIVGTHDHICNAIGSGVVEAGCCVDTVGTTEGLTAVLKREELPPEYIERYQISCEPFVTEQLYNTVAWNNTSGVLLKWFVKDILKEEKQENILRMFMKLNSQLKTGPTDLWVLPHFSGAATPYMDSASKGAILGLTLDTKCEDFYKALMEGANYELAVILGVLKEAGLTIQKLVATGGALSPELLQIKADILGMPVFTVQNRQTGTMGGAILGAVASGRYTSVQEGVCMMVTEDKVYEPDPERVVLYKEKLELYKLVYPAVVGLSHKMTR